MNLFWKAILIVERKIHHEKMLMLLKLFKNDDVINMMAVNIVFDIGKAVVYRVWISQKASMNINFYTKIKICLSKDNN